MTMSEKLRVGITHGDVNGVGYEVILKAFEDPTMLDFCIPIVYGSPKVAAYHRKAIDCTTNFTIISNVSITSVYNHLYSTFSIYYIFSIYFVYCCH